MNRNAVIVLALVALIGYYVFVFNGPAISSFFSGIASEFESDSSYEVPDLDVFDDDAQSQVSEIIDSSMPDPHDPIVSDIEPPPAVEPPTDPESEDGDNSGTTVLQGADRPTEIPNMFPSLEGAYDFQWVDTNDTQVLQYYMKSENANSVCNSQTGLLLEAGWQADEEIFSNGDTTAVRAFVDGTWKLYVTCTYNTYDKTVLINLVQNQEMY